MGKSAPLTNIFKADPKATVLPIGIHGLSLPKVESAGLLADPSYNRVEGRGTYEELPNASGRYRYVKGAGNAESLRSADEHDERNFPQFGHTTREQFCFGTRGRVDIDGILPPMVRGALALPSAVGEVVHAAVFLKTVMKNEGIRTIAEAEAKGLTVPEGVIYSSAVSSDVCDGLARVMGDSAQSGPMSPLNYKFGLAALRVPACSRLRARDDVTTSKGEFWSRTLRSTEKMEMVGRVLKHQLHGGFITISTHLQNVYNAPHSLCPHADNSDLVPISEIMEAGVEAKIESRLLLKALVMRQLQFLPFNLMRYADQPELQNDAKGAIHTILSTVAPGEWSRREREAFAVNFQEKPYVVLSTIANRLIDMELVSTEPQVDWKKMRSDYSRFSYDIVARHLVGVALASACSLVTNVADAEAQGGLSDLY